MSQAFVDESIAGDYLVACCVIPSSGVAHARRTVKGLLLPGQRSLHMKDERAARHGLILDAMVGLTPTVTVYRARPRDLGGSNPARDACLQLMAQDCVAAGVTRMVLDRIESLEVRDRRSIIAGTMAAGADKVPYSYDHLHRHEELLLALPDAFAWAYARGGAMRARVVSHLTVRDIGAP